MSVSLSDSNGQTPYKHLWLNAFFNLKGIERLEHAQLILIVSHPQGLHEFQLVPPAAGLDSCDKIMPLWLRLRVH